MAARPDPWRAYLVRCGDGSLYAGVSNDVARRVAAHAAGRGARYTRSRPPIVLAWTSPPLGKREAHRLEARLKRLPRSAKLALADGERRVRRMLLAGLSAPGPGRGRAPRPARGPANPPSGSR